MASAIDQFSSGLENTNCWRVGGVEIFRFTSARLGSFRLFGRKRFLAMQAYGGASSERF